MKILHIAVPDEVDITELGDSIHNGTCAHTIAISDDLEVLYDWMSKDIPYENKKKPSNVWYCLSGVEVST